MQNFLNYAIDTYLWEKKTTPVMDGVEGEVGEFKG